MHPGIAAWVSELTRRNLLVTVMVVLVVSISSVWSFVNVQQEVRNARSVLLNSVLNAQVEALAIWVGENKFGTAQLAAERSFNQFWRPSCAAFKRSFNAFSFPSSIS